jgi:PAS domain S-box-containing protein
VTINKDNHHKPFLPDLTVSILAGLPHPVLVINPPYVLYANSVAREKILNNEFVDNQLVENLSSPELVQVLSRKLKCILASGKSTRGRLSVPIPEGSSAIYHLDLKVTDNSKNLIIVTFTNVTREELLRKRLDNLHRSMESFYPGKMDENLLFKRLNEAVMQSANTIVITNLDGNIVFANPKFEETTGYTLKEAYMKNPRILKSGDQPISYYKELWKTISSGKVWKGEFKNKNKFGKYYWESATITPVKNAAGEVVEYLAIKEDITERKLVEEKLEKALVDMEISNWEYKMLNKDLKQEVEIRNKVESELKLQKELLQELNENLASQIDQEVKKNREKDELMLLQSRQAAMGEMIGNIAHQWRQPLNAIGLMIYDLTDAFRFGEITNEYVDKSERDIKSVLEHMSRTIDDFRNFFKPNKEKQHFLLHEIVKTSVSFLDATLKNSGIRLITEVDKDIMLYGYSSEFAQVLLNIVNNSKDALQDHKPDKPVVRISGTVVQNKAIVVIVDNGGGIPADVIHKIYDPYFTTKEQGKGTGVGLYMSKTIIERNMGGSISVRNTRAGAEFKIEIPLSKI